MRDEMADGPKRRPTPESSADHPPGAEPTRPDRGPPRGVGRSPSRGPAPRSAHVPLTQQEEIHAQGHQTHPHRSGCDRCRRGRRQPKFRKRGDTRFGRPTCHGRRVLPPSRGPVHLAPERSGGPYERRGLPPSRRPLHRADGRSGRCDKRRALPPPRGPLHRADERSGRSDKRRALPPPRRPLHRTRECSHRDERSIAARDSRHFADRVSVGRRRDRRSGSVPPVERSRRSHDRRATPPPSAGNKHVTSTSTGR